VEHCIGKRLHVVNLGFTLLDEGCKAWSCESNLCLAIIKQLEKYDAMKNALGYQVSGSAYHEFAKICQEMPRHYKLKRRISELKSLWSIQLTLMVQVSNSH